MLKGMLEKKIKKKERCIPKESMPHAHKACQKEKKRERESTSMENKEERWVMQRSSSILHTKKTNIPTHLHILIRLYDSFLLGSCF